MSQEHQKANNTLTSEQKLEDKVRVWQNENPLATLTEIETMIDGQLAIVRRQLVESVFVEKAEEATVNCPQCENAMVKNGKKHRQLQIKGGETVSFSRSQRRCRKCGTTIFPPG